MNKLGLNWNKDGAIIADCGTFQNDEGEPVAWAKLAFMGGMASLKITPDDLKRLSPLKGKEVNINGTFTYEIKKGSGKETMSFYVDQVTPVK